MNGRKVCDRVHGQIILPAAVMHLVNTPEFNRLDRIRQLGASSYVYPSATHTRREHALGVCHLSGEMGKHLQSRHPELIDDDDILCLEIAGLLHDLGHGPFSHSFEEFMHRECPGWSHEEMGIKIFDLMLERRGIDFTRYFSKGVKENTNFVKLLISGLSPWEEWPSDCGRGEEKRFLLGIVSNQVSASPHAPPLPIPHFSRSPYSVGHRDRRR
jgi:HD superfamily phosphohydrolase